MRPIKRAEHGHAIGRRNAKARVLDCSTTTCQKGSCTTRAVTVPPIRDLFAAGADVVQIETPEVMVARICRALPFVAKERVILASDCGMKYLPREMAMGKLQAKVEAARMLRSEFAAG